MNIREWPAEERPREKLLQRGAAALSDAELLAVLLGSGLPGGMCWTLRGGCWGVLVGSGSFSRPIAQQCFASRALAL